MWHSAGTRWIQVMHCAVEKRGVTLLELPDFFLKFIQLVVFTPERLVLELFHVVDESHTLSRFDHSSQADFSASYVMHTAAAANTSSQHDPESATAQ